MGWEIYDLLIDKVRPGMAVKQVTLGLSWSLAELQSTDIPALGLCFSPLIASRTLNWPGTLRDRDSHELAQWLKSWEPAQASVGLCIANAAINANAAALHEAVPLENNAPGHLKVFAHFKSRLQGKKIVVIGRYPGLDQLWSGLEYECIERNPQTGDLPDTAAHYLLPDADWVFITASSIANKTLPHLLKLARQAKVVLMGPSLPWMHEWTLFGVDYLAGVRIHNPDFLRQVVAEGGGTRLFEGGVHYCLWGE